MRPAKGGGGRHLLHLFIVAAAARILLDIVFFAAFGPHAVNTVELWLYFGVATGRHLTAGGLQDPTVWLLHAMGSVLSGDGLFYGIAALSILLTALAAVLVCLLVREFTDDETGYVAGAVYAFMVQPLYLSLPGFTHDNLLTPLALACLLSFIRMVKDEDSMRKAVYGLFSVLAFYLGSHIHIGMYVVAGVAAVYFAAHLMRRYPEYYPQFTAALIVCFTIIGFCILPRVMDYQLGMLPQGRMGSADVLPISLGNIWLRYNVLLLFLPWGAYAAYKRREYVSLSYAAIGFIFANVMDRGTRLSDIGVAMLVAYALMKAAPKLTGFAHLAAAAFAASMFFMLVPLAQSVLIIVSGGALAYLDRSGRLNRWAVVAVIGILGVSLTFADMFANTGHIVSEAEYLLYSETLDMLPPGRVLTPWDKGFMVDALSASSAVSSPEAIDYMAHEALWMPQEQAFAVLSREGVDYVVFSDGYFNNAVIEGREYYVLEGGQMLTPKDKPPISLSPEITGYVLRYGGYDERHFTKVAEHDNPISGAGYVIYRVAKASTNRTMVSLAAYNNEDGPVDARVVVAVETYEGGKKPRPVYGATKDELFAIGHYLACAIGASARLLSLALLAAIVHALSLMPGSGGKAVKSLRNRLFILVLALALLAAATHPTSQTTEETTPKPLTNAAHMSFNITFTENMSVTALDIGDVGDIYDCNFTVEGDTPAGFVGSVTFRNGCGKIEGKARILLVDATASAALGTTAIEDYRELDLTMSDADKITRQYAFNRKNPSHEYAVGFWKPDCISIVPEETTGPRPSGVEAVHAFCGKATDLRDYDRIA